VTAVLLLALAWLVLSGSFAPWNVAFAIAAGFLASRFTPPARGARWTLRRALGLLRLSVYFVWALLEANVRVAIAVLGPRRRMSPAIVAVPLDARTDAEITLFANLVTLTPGTLSVDVSADRRVLYVHALWFDGDAEALRRSIKDGFERRVLGALR
jgi:multicomponent Na+:H+ antiporter subunit E